MQQLDQKTLQSLILKNSPSGSQKLKEKRCRPIRRPNNQSSVYESPYESTSSEDDDEDEEELLSLPSSGTPGSSDNEQVFDKDPKIPVKSSTSLPVAKKSGIKSLSSLSTPPKVNIVSGWKRQGQAKTSTSSDLNISGVAGGGAGGGAEGETDKNEVVPDGWNGQEIILFCMLRPIYCHNYCSMAEVIESKTCQEVL